MNPTNRAFTLIELLVVVAIIAILASIAIPNFLEAQTRAKVSRVKSDLRTLATALESYQVDNNRPVFDGLPGGPHFGWVNSWSKVTTPISYMTTILIDPFQDSTFPDTDHPQFTHFLDGKFSGKNHAYDYGGGLWHGSGRPGGEEYDRNFRGSQWKIGSAGPDKRFENDGSFYGMKEFYDPTNGTVSDGDVYRSQKGQL